MSEGKKIVVIADEYVATAFRIVGVDARVASSVEEARRHLEDAARDPNVAAIFVANEFADKLSDIMERVRRERSDIIVSNLPTPRTPGKPVDMRRLLLQALGIG